MNIEECHLQLRSVVSPPFERNDPEVDWVESRDAKTIPAVLYDFYRATRYLSASALAGFDSPEARVITVYFGRLVRGLKECLVDAAESLAEMHQFASRVYTPLRKYPYEWDRDAARRERSSFRVVLINLLGALDVFAELAVLMLPEEITGVTAGNALFSQFEKWLQKPAASHASIVTPQQHFAQKLYGQIAPLVIVKAGPERDWLPLLRLYRNKVAHHGHQTFVHVGLEAKDGRVGFFLPRSWPFVAEQYATTGEPWVPRDEPVDFSEVLKSWLTHQDIEQYADGAHRKVASVIERGLELLLEMYLQNRSIPVSSRTLADLEKSKKSYDFQRFESGS